MPVIHPENVAASALAKHAHKKITTALLDYMKGLLSPCPASWAKKSVDQKSLYKNVGPKMVGLLIQNLEGVSSLYGVTDLSSMGPLLF